MNVVVAVVAGWLGLNGLILAWAGVVVWLRRHEPDRIDVHDL